jgi:hypothetical protein
MVTGRSADDPFRMERDLAVDTTSGRPPQGDGRDQLVSFAC